MQVNQILHGSALDQLKTLASDSVDCCITSPPYWALRDYKTPGQLGLEPTFQEYITKLIEIFEQVKRVLKKEGSCWVNMGDTYSRSGSTNVPDTLTKIQRDIPLKDGKKQFSMISSTPKKSLDILEKSLCLIPQRFQIAMVDQGWICRNTIIWYKPNCMPSSAKDRFTVDFEYLFFFTKSQKYYFETQYEPHERDWSKEAWTKTKTKDYQNKPRYEGHDSNTNRIYRLGYGITKSEKTVADCYNPLGRIKRCVWKIPTQPFSDAHFAVFPPALVATPLRATCPEYICKRCGKAREKILEHIGDRDHCHYTTRSPKNSALGIVSHKSSLVTGFVKEYKETGLSDCGCNAGFDAGVCLDPFLGSGTVALVAMQNARNFLGIELNEEYIKIAIDRLKPYLLQTRLL